MSNLSKQQFGPMYHGTKAVIKDHIIRPGTGGLAYATSDPGSAELFGKTKTPSGEVEENKVYRVMPLAQDVSTKAGNFKGETHYSSPTGFFITGQYFPPNKETK
jgi:hypothetical protein